MTNGESRYRQRELERENLQNLLVQSAILLFTEQGYGAAEFEEISRRAGLDRGALYSVFESKEKALFEVVGVIFMDLFHAAVELASGKPLAVRYGAMVAIAMHMAHSSDSIWDAFVAAYSIPKTIKMLNIVTGNELERILAPYLLEANSTEDLYELNAETGVLFGEYISYPCAQGEMVREKVARFLGRVLPLYCVPEDIQKQVIDLAVSVQAETAARALIGKIHNNAVAALQKYKKIIKDSDREEAL